MERRPPSRPRSEDLERKKCREKECVKHVAKTKIDVLVSPVCRSNSLFPPGAVLVSAGGHLLVPLR